MDKTNATHGDSMTSVFFIHIRVLVKPKSRIIINAGYNYAISISSQLINEVRDCVWQRGECIGQGKEPSINVSHGITGAELKGTLPDTKLRVIINLTVGFEKQSLLKDILIGVMKDPEKKIKQIIADELKIPSVEKKQEPKKSDSLDFRMT